MKLPKTKTNCRKWQLVLCRECGALTGAPCLNMFGAKAKRIHRVRMTDLQAERDAAGEGKS